ncbi:hypothetical protein ACNRC9_01425, partial [Ralstonia pseudosolanacearum]|uniref:hypothetical protein n=1 Tax=Ralstonia pseudosolanacearum TaxID=1310165 RepID=UPI003AABF0F6
MICFESDNAGYACLFRHLFQHFTLFEHGFQPFGQVVFERLKVPWRFGLVGNDRSMLDVKREPFTGLLALVRTSHDDWPPRCIRESKLVPDIRVIFGDVRETDCSSLDVLFDSLDQHRGGRILIDPIGHHPCGFDGRLV